MADIIHPQATTKIPTATTIDTIIDTTHDTIPITSDVENGSGAETGNVGRNDETTTEIASVETFDERKESLSSSADSWKRSVAETKKLAAGRKSSDGRRVANPAGLNAGANVAIRSASAVAKTSEHRTAIPAFAFARNP